MRSLQGEPQRSLGHRVRVLEGDVVLSSTALVRGQSLSLGRGGESDVLVGGGTDQTLPDGRISRSAILVVVDTSQWDITITNSNGAIIRPWLAGPIRLRRDARTIVTRPGVCIDLPGTRGRCHRILLERHSTAPDYDVGRSRSAVQRETVRDGDGTQRMTPVEVGLTEPITDRRLRALEQTQVDAIHAVFAEHLRWPPVPDPTTLKLAAAAAHLGVSSRAVTQRLEKARKRVHDLIGERSSVTQRALVHALAERGLLVFQYEPDT